VVIEQTGQDRKENVKIFASNARVKSGKVRIKRACKKKKVQKIVKNLQKLQKMCAF
jgi:hypothetical protein